MIRIVILSSRFSIFNLLCLLNHNNHIYLSDLSQRINQMARDVGIDPAILDQPYSRKHLLAISQKLTNWKAYTDYLGLSLVDEQAIQTNIFLTAPHQRPLEMLKTWMQRCAGTTKVHYRYLVKACLEVGGDTSLAGCVCRLANSEYRCALLIHPVNLIIQLVQKWG